jgi:lipopolysaccharide export system protein LptA
MDVMIIFPRRVLLVSALLFLHLLASGALSADLKEFKLGKGKGGPEQPLVIKSNHLEIDNGKKTVTFSGNVDARKDDWIINCQKMILFYNKNEQTAKSAAEDEKLRVDKIIAKGDVQIRQSGGGMATAEEATYYQADERVVLTGKPVVKQGDDFVEGLKITLFLKENRSIVEGTEENKVRAVIAPRSQQR